MRLRRGFSLVEVIVTLFVVFLVFGVGAGLLSEYSSVLKFSGAMENYFVVAQSAMHQMVAEARESQVLLSPSSSGLSSDLTFQRIDPNYQWLPAPFDPISTRRPEAGQGANRPPTWSWSTTRYPPIS